MITAYILLLNLLSTHSGYKLDYGIIMYNILCSSVVRFLIFEFKKNYEIEGGGNKWVELFGHQMKYITSIKS